MREIDRMALLAVTGEFLSIEEGTALQAVTWELNPTEDIAALLAVMRELELINRVTRTNPNAGASLGLGS